MTNTNTAADIISTEFINDEPIRTDLDIWFNNELVEELKDVGPQEAGPHLDAAILAATLGLPIELHFSNPEVYEQVGAVFNAVGVKVVLKAA